MMTIMRGRSEGEVTMCDEKCRPRREAACGGGLACFELCGAVYVVLQRKAKGQSRTGTPMYGFSGAMSYMIAELQYLICSNTRNSLDTNCKSLNRSAVCTVYTAGAWTHDHEPRKPINGSYSKSSHTVRGPGTRRLVRFITYVYLCVIARLVIWSTCTTVLVQV